MAVAGATVLGVVLAAGLIRPGLFGDRPEHTGPAQAHDRLYIAVLPLRNLTDAAGQDYFSDGITEDVIAALGRFPQLGVISHAAVMRYKNTTVEPEQLADELDVRYMLEGSVRKTEDRVRVTVQLTDLKTGLLLWDQRYDQDLGDVFEVQDAIARQVASTLSSKLDQIERERVVDKPTGSMAAYDFVLHGWDYLSRRDVSGILRAREAFQHAVDLDPDYAIAYVGLGFCDYTAVISGFEEFVAERLERAHSLAEQALDRGPATAPAHRLLGLIHLYRREYDEARRELATAIDLNPSDAISYASQGAVLLYSGQPEQAIEFLEATRRLNPILGSGSLINLGLAYLLVDRPGDAIRVLKERTESQQDHLARVPDYFRHVGLAAALARLDRFDEARDAAEEAVRQWPFFSAEQFVSQFQDPAAQSAMLESLRAAGLR
jgi:TolB-like protein/Flp pilus assembly protein TadD